MRDMSSTVVDDAEEMLTGGIDMAAIVRIKPAVLPKVLGGDQIGKADDRVEGRSKLMTHIGKEFGLGVIALIASSRSTFNCALSVASVSAWLRNLALPASTSVVARISSVTIKAGRSRG